LTPTVAAMADLAGHFVSAVAFAIGQPEDVGSTREI
jgi:hypothetical protein